jgi:hypothetical protein
MRRDPNAARWAKIRSMAFIDTTLKCQGSLADLPTIILEADGGCTAEQWSFVQERLAQRTLAVSYDRAEHGSGKGWPDDLSATGVATRLEVLFDGAQIAPRRYSKTAAVVW